MKRIGEDLHNIINSQSQLIITNKESDDRSLFSDSDNRGSETESCFSGFDSECDIVTPGYNIDNTHVERYTDTKMDTRKFLGEHCRGNNNITRLITCSENPPNLQDLSFNKRKRDETEALHYDKCADKGGHLCRRKITIVCHTTREKSGRHLRTGGGSRVNTHVECHKINQIPTERIFVNKNQVKDHNSCKIGENKNCVAPHHVTQYLLNPLILNKHNGGNLSNVEANSEKPNFFAINQDARQWVSTDHHQTLQLQSQTSKCTEKKEQCGTLQKVSNEGNGCFRVCIGTGTALQESSEEDGLIPWEDDFMLVPFEAEGTQSPTMFDIVGESNHSEEEISGERTNSCQTLNNKGGNKQLYRSYSSPNRDGHMESSPFIPTIVGPGQLAPNYLRCSPERIGEIGAVEDVITDDSECSRRDDDNIIFQDHSYSANPENHLKCKCISNSARISQENDCCAIVYDSALEVAENVVVPHDKLAEDEFDNCKGRDEGSTEENRNTSDTAVNRSIINCRNNLDEISTMTHVAQSTNSRSVYGKRVVELEQKHPEKSSNSISESGSYMPSVQDLVKRISKEVTVKVIPSVNVSTVSTNDTAKDPKEIKKKDSKMVTSKSDSCTEIDNNLNSTCSMKRKAVSSPEECLQTDFNFEAHSEKFVKMDDNWVVIYSKMSEPQKIK
nr:uncharacterized protein LOC128705373 [Cherax quadricarinatus]